METIQTQKPRREDRGLEEETILRKLSSALDGFVWVGGARNGTVGGASRARATGLAGRYDLTFSLLHMSNYRSVPMFAIGRFNRR